MQDTTQATNELWSEYRSTCQELAKLKSKAELLRTRVQATSPYKTLTRVRHDNQVYYIYSSELWAAIDHEEKPTFWLTLTKLTKYGKFPGKPMQSDYANSKDVEIIGRFGDLEAEKYGEVRQ